MQIASGLPRVDAMATPAARSVPGYAKTGWRHRCRSGLIAGATAIVALSSTYRGAHAQIKIVDQNFYEVADPVIEETRGILKKEMCLSHFRAEELKKRIGDTIREMKPGDETLREAHSAKQISDELFTLVRGKALGRLRDLQALYRRVEAFPRCRAPGAAQPGTPGDAGVFRHGNWPEEIRRPITPGAGPQEPAKLYSVGRPLEPAKLNSVGTLVKPPVHWSGWYVAVDGSENFNTLGQQERFKMNGAVTNDFSDSSQATGFGFGAGYLLQTGLPNIVVGASGSLDVLNQDVNHNFAGGFFLGQTTGVIGSVNALVGVAAAPNLLLYAEAGPAFASLTHKLNFSGVETSVDKWVAGLNLAIGAAYQPPDWQVGGHAVAIFGQINRIILPDTTFDNPGSPGFIYSNHTNITKVEVGVRIQELALHEWLTIGVRGAYGIW
jgi:opacity protein-like surface antigen